jgi:hypothetical protein
MQTMDAMDAMDAMPRPRWMNQIDENENCWQQCREQDES